MPVLETERLRIREFSLEDLRAVHQLLDVDLGDGDSRSLEQRRRWLDWTILNYAQLAELHQPPYGDRAVELRLTGELVGVCGFAPCLGPYRDSERYVAEVGLYWATSSAHQRRGFASEAGAALVTYGFETLHLERVIATTTFDNAASIGVMRNLGMRIERNPWSEPAWFQVMGLLDAD